MYQFNISLLNTINGHNSKNLENLHLFCSFTAFQSWIYKKYGLCRSDYYTLCNGKKIDIPTLEGGLNISDSVISIVPKIVGGKGGFGSMLRAIGAQIEKTTNREACRDLSGRRLRDINEEKRLKNWIAQQADREREVAERKKKKLERLCQEPKHEFKDELYEESRSNVTEKMSNSIEQGLKASTSGVDQVGSKRKIVNDKSKQTNKKKRKLWIDEEDSDSDSSENEASPVKTENIKKE